MLTEEQAKNIGVVTERFNELENVNTWSSIDDALEYLEWLNDYQLYVEAELLLERAKEGDPRCDSSHPKSKCIVPLIIEAVELILNGQAESQLSKETKMMVLKYFLALCNIGFIIF